MSEICVELEDVFENDMGYTSLKCPKCGCEHTHAYNIAFAPRGNGSDGYATIRMYCENGCKFSFVLHQHEGITFLEFEDDGKVNPGDTKVWPCEATATDTRVMSKWPRFADGSPVMPGDLMPTSQKDALAVKSVEIDSKGYRIRGQRTCIINEGTNDELMQPRTVAEASEEPFEWYA